MFRSSFAEAYQQAINGHRIRMVSPDRRDWLVASYDQGSKVLRWEGDGEAVVAAAWVMHAAWEVVPKEASGTKCPEHEKPASKWEYKTLLCNAPQSEDVQEELNRIGDDGWELVVTNTSGRYIFKRPKQ